MTSILDWVLERAARVAPGQLGAALDELRPGLAEALGGPFNGQERRLDAVRDMFAAIPFAVVVETGTFRATTTMLLRDLTAAPIVTVEVNPRYYYYARRRISQAQNISLLRGHSPGVLRSIAADAKWNCGPAFFYLDAHWRADLPLVAELTAIAQGWRSYVVLIDDFRVPDDPGYTYDDYGPGKVLEPAILAPLAKESLSVFWPTAPSNSEAGARRGWVVLATVGPVGDALRRLPGLRLAGSLADVLNGAGPLASE